MIGRDGQVPDNDGMKYGIILTAGTLDEMIALATEAEANGWDGVFYWDAIAIGDSLIYDPWVTMAAFAMATERVRLGAIITPPSRRRPWKLAKETATLAHLSHGRLVLPVGLGVLDDQGYRNVGEKTDLRTRAEMLDESLEILTRAWTGEPFSFDGKHYQISEMHQQPASYQQPRIPIWVAGFYPNPAPLRRAARWDGMFAIRPNDPIQPDDWRQILTTIAELRSDMAHYDAIHSDITQGEADRERVTAYARAGVTWWLEDISPVRVGWPLGADWPEPWDVDAITARIARGPITGVE